MVPTFMLLLPFLSRQLWSFILYDEGSDVRNLEILPWPISPVQLLVTICATSAIPIGGILSMNSYGQDLGPSSEKSLQCSDHD